MFKLLIIRYCQKLPLNFFEILKKLRWFAFEIQGSVSNMFIEDVYETLYYLLSNELILIHLKEEIIPKSLSMINLGLLAGLFENIGISKNKFEQAFDKPTIARCIQNYRQSRFRGREHHVTWIEILVWNNLYKNNPAIAAFFLDQFSYQSLLTYGKRSIRGLSDVISIAAKDGDLKAKLSEDLEELFGDKESFLKKISIKREVSLHFAIRNIGIYGGEAISLFKSLISPNDLADIAKGLERITGKFFYNVYRYLGEEYFEALTEKVSEDFVYQVFFKKPLEKIHYGTNYRLFIQFIEEDIESKFRESNLFQIQKFLQNVCLHGFAKWQKDQLIELLDSESYIKLLIDKINSMGSEFAPFSFLVRNLTALSPKVAKNLIARLFCDFRLERELYAEADLLMLSNLIMNIYLVHSIELNRIIDPRAFHSVIYKNLRNYSSPEIAALAGLVRYFDLDTSLELVIDKFLSTMEKYFDNNVRELKAKSDDVLDSNWNRWAFLRLALLLIGIRYLCGLYDKGPGVLEIEKGFLRNHFQAIRQQILGEEMTVIGQAFGQLPVLTERKIKMVDMALESLDYLSWE